MLDDRVEAADVVLIVGLHRTLALAAAHLARDRGAPASWTAGAEAAYP
jgi:hypothetical protein